MNETATKEKKALAAEKKAAEVVEEVAGDLNISLPEAGEAPIGVRIITLLVLMSGITIVGSVLAEAYTFEPIDIPRFLLRTLMGVLLLAIAYALNRRKFYALWLLGAAVAFALFSNIYLSAIPVAVLFYIYRNRAILRTQILTLGRIKIRI